MLNALLMSACSRASGVIYDALRRRAEDTVSLLGDLGSANVETQHDIRARESFGWREAHAINRHRLFQVCRCEMRCKRKRQPQGGRKLSAKEARAQNPNRHVQARPRNGAHSLAG